MILCESGTTEVMVPTWLEDALLFGNWKLTLLKRLKNSARN